jgi:hypothetical protein
MKYLEIDDLECGQLYLWNSPQLDCEWDLIKYLGDGRIFTLTSKWYKIKLHTEYVGNGSVFKPATHVEILFYDYLA